MTEYTNSFDDLRGDILRTFESVGAMADAQQRFDAALTLEIERLWEDNGALRDELHALANRVESLTRNVVSGARDE